MGKAVRNQGLNKKGSQIGSFIFYTIISSIIFILIYSIAFNPQTTSKINEIGTNLKTSLKSNADEDTSGKKCLTQVKSVIAQTESVSMTGNLQIKIQDYQSFSTKEEAIAYLKNIPTIGEPSSNIPTELTKSKDNSNVTIVNTIIGIKQAEGGLRSFLTCVNGRLVESSEIKLRSFAKIPI